MEREIKGQWPLKPSGTGGGLSVLGATYSSLEDGRPPNPKPLWMANSVWSLKEGAPFKDRHGLGACIWAFIWDRLSGPRIHVVQGDGPWTPVPPQGIDFKLLKGYLWKVQLKLPMKSAMAGDG